jgi:hypothetical protein
MPRLRLLDDHELPEAMQKRLQPGEQNDILRTFGHHPDLFTAWNGFYRNIMVDGAVPVRLKEMMRLRIARLNECMV